MSDELRALDQDEGPTLSIVIPVYNESENIIPLYERLFKVLEQHGLSSEILFVDDGSTDGSANIIRELHTRDPRVKLLSFSRNFGHQIAISAGIDYSRGRALIVMDGDLQHPPELIPRLVECWRAGYEVVYTVRQETADASGFKKLTSRWFYRALRVLAGVWIPEGSADFRLMDHQVAQVFTQIREQDRFLRGLIPWMGFRQIGVPYVAAERHAGRSKYSTLRMVSFGLDGIVSLSFVPLRLSFYTGLSVSLLGALYALYGLGVFIAGRTLP
jgi:polyisoprenyl-phosphate glycosyltransferase